uniref:Uncharacterized protein n=1 Tax=viral metagenome TaxID=1070528 RepID=A0A6M3IZK5_9ZZZZ
MATQQAWDDFEALKLIIQVTNIEIDGTLKAYLDTANQLKADIVDDPERAATVAPIANAHPIYTPVYISTGINKLVVLRTFMINNGYIEE